MSFVASGLSLYTPELVVARSLIPRLICVLALVAALAATQPARRGKIDRGRLGVWYYSSRNVDVKEEDDDEVPVLERAGDPPSSAEAQPHLTAAPRAVTYGPYASVQVNVDAKGKNILGDAANEPSMAIDPKNPNKIVAGWRQFDNVTSNFRQAGNAYSTDGGKTWHNNTVLTKGTFRSDPVLGVDAKSNFYYNSLQQTFFTDVFKAPTGDKWTIIGPAMGGDKQWMAVDSTGSPGKGNIYESWSTAGNNYGGRQFSRSTDGGKTWMDPIDIPGSPVWGTMDIASNGDLYIGALGSQAFEFVRSTNAKYAIDPPTFDKTVNVNLGGGIVYGSFMNPAGLLGQTWIATDKSKGPYAGSIYMLSSVGVDGNNPCDVNFARSTDGGSTWSNYSRVNDDPLDSGAIHWFGALSVSSTGRLDACWLDNRANPGKTKSALFTSSSYDGGATWLPSRQVSPSFDPSIGYPNQNKMGDYIGVISDATGTNVIYSATFNGEEDVWFQRIPVIAQQPVAASAVKAFQGTYLNGSLSSIQSSDGSTYDIQSVNVSGQGQSAEIQADFPMPVKNPLLMSVQLKASATPQSTGVAWIYNWSSKSFVLLQNFTFDASGSANLSIGVKTVAPAYFDSTGKVRVLIRALVPTKLAGGKSFKFQTDLLQLLYG